MPGKIIPFEKERLEVINKDDENYELIIYGAIGESYYSDSTVSAKKFLEELKKIPNNAKEIVLRINSPGGSVFDGMTIYERLKQHKAKIKVYIDGIAASIASIIAMAGDEISIGEGGMVMIHLPMSGVYGNKIDMEKTIEILEKIESQMIGIYSRKSGQTSAKISKMLMDETWMTSDEAVEMGFATKKISVKNSMRLAASMLEKNEYFKKRPDLKNIVRQQESEKVLDLKNKIQDFLARK